MKIIHSNAAADDDDDAAAAADDDDDFLSIYRSPYIFSSIKSTYPS